MPEATKRPQNQTVSSELPPIPAKRYFTIGEVSELCDVKPYVLRYWEQEFTQLRPMKRRGNRRYYQHHEVLLVRRIRELLYEQRFTISGARDRLAEAGSVQPFLRGGAAEDAAPQDIPGLPVVEPEVDLANGSGELDLRRELLAIRRLLAD